MYNVDSLQQPSSDSVSHHRYLEIPFFLWRWLKSPKMLYALHVVLTLSQEEELNLELFPFRHLQSSTAREWDEGWVMMFINPFVKTDCHLLAYAHDSWSTHNCLTWVVATNGHFPEKLTNENLQHLRIEFEGHFAFLTQSPRLPWDDIKFSLEHVIKYIQWEGNMYRKVWKGIWWSNMPWLAEERLLILDFVINIWCMLQLRI